MLKDFYEEYISSEEYDYMTIDEYDLFIEEKNKREENFRRTKEYFSQLEIDVINQPEIALI